MRIEQTIKTITIIGLSLFLGIIIAAGYYGREFVGDAVIDILIASIVFILTGLTINILPLTKIKPSYLLLIPVMYIPVFSVLYDFATHFDSNKEITTSTYHYFMEIVFFYTSNRIVLVIPRLFNFIRSHW